MRRRGRWGGQLHAYARVSTGVLQRQRSIPWSWGMGSSLALAGWCWRAGVGGLSLAGWCWRAGVVPTPPHSLIDLVGGLATGRISLFRECARVHTHTHARTHARTSTHSPPPPPIRERARAPGLFARARDPCVCARGPYTHSPYTQSVHRVRTPHTQGTNTESVRTHTQSP
jgi:hypothetical protein